MVIQEASPLYSLYGPGQSQDDQSRWMGMPFGPRTRFKGYTSDHVLINAIRCYKII
ncbi:MULTISPECIES: hypothetical protein [unclassified Sphingobacterium]|uniref:hypothetical protein n=1 Tax=unclassified Sphingobacterium TaxID=2609468 RepID=UPI0025E7808C|nr:MULTISPECIES: hypothetical protein [unclassified Sphingobacterium]